MRKQEYNEHLNDVVQSAADINPVVRTSGSGRAITALVSLLPVLAIVSGTY